MHKVFYYKHYRIRIDSQDVELYRAHRWIVGNINGYPYVFRRARHGDAYKTMYFHREVVGATSRAVVVDHRNHDTLDNRRSNLKVTDTRGNALNSLRTQQVPAIDVHHGTYRIRIRMPDGKRHVKTSASKEVLIEWWKAMDAQRRS